MTTIIAAIAENNVIGKDGKLPWRLPEDMALFKEKTHGQIVVMGRKTWESIPEKFRPLPDRTNIVVSSSLISSKCHTCTSIEEAIETGKKLAPDKEIFLIGGTHIYKKALEYNLVDKMIISHVEGSYDGDAHFPEIGKEWNPVTAESKVGFIVIEYRKLPLVADDIN